MEGGADEKPKAGAVDAGAADIPKPAGAVVETVDPNGVGAPNEGVPNVGAEAGAGGFGAAPKLGAGVDCIPKDGAGAAPNPVAAVDVPKVGADVPNVVGSDGAPNVAGA